MMNKVNRMSYLLKQYNTPLLEFEYIETIDNVKVEIVKPYYLWIVIRLMIVYTDGLKSELFLLTEPMFRTSSPETD